MGGVSAVVGEDRVAPREAGVMVQVARPPTTGTAAHPGNAGPLPTRKATVPLAVSGVTVDCKTTGTFSTAVVVSWTVVAVIRLSP